MALWGTYFGALATASSFYAIFFFFWTRTGDRKGKIDIETKKIYLIPIYWILRFSLLMIILTKVVEVFLVQRQLLVIYNIDLSLVDILVSKHSFFVFVILAILAINSAAMYFKKINFSYAIPIAVVSYFYLFLSSTKSIYTDILTYTQKAGEETVFTVCIYLVSVVVFYIIFSLLSKKVRS